MTAETLQTLAELLAVVLLYLFGARIPGPFRRILGALERHEKRLDRLEAMLTPGPRRVDVPGIQVVRRPRPKTDGDT